MSALDRLREHTDVTWSERDSRDGNPCIEVSNSGIGLLITR